MCRVTRIGGFVMALAAAVAVGACATLDVKSYQEPRADVAGYRSYTWQHAEAFSTGDARLDNNRFFSERVQSAVEQELGRRGLEKVESAAADVTLHIHARVAQRLDTTAIDRQYGQCDRPDCWPRVFDAGTLVIDFVDARTGTLAWRGWAEGSFDGVIDDQVWMEQTIDKAVAKILARLPTAR